MCLVSLNRLIVYAIFSTCREIKKGRTVGPVRPADKFLFYCENVVKSFFRWSKPHCLREGLGSLFKPFNPLHPFGRTQRGLAEKTLAIRRIRIGLKTTTFNAVIRIEFLVKVKHPQSMPVSASPLVHCLTTILNSTLRGVNTPNGVSLYFGQGAQLHSFSFFILP